MVNIITSIQNEQVKNWRKLHRRKYREETGSFLIEGSHLLEEAYETDQDIEAIIVQEGREAPAWFDSDFVYTVSENVFKEISQTKSPQGIAAVIKRTKGQAPNGKYVLLLDAIQDPGNLGTILRTADAAGFSKVVLGEGTVDLYNDKVIRASQGSLFHIAIEQKSLEEVIPDLKSDGFSIWGTSLKRANNYRNVTPGEKTAILLGNEGRGVSDKWLRLADELVKIPIYGKAESLNVGIAAGILMYYVRK